MASNNAIYVPVADPDSAEADFEDLDEMEEMEEEQALFRPDVSKVTITLEEMQPHTNPRYGRDEIGIGESEILYTIDTVCHGVTSPGMFKKYMEKIYRSRHLDSFRYKNPYEISTYAFSFTDGKRINGQLDPFFNSFLRGRSFRESCYSCKYACPERIGDITLGDCANFRAYPSLAGKPISTVLINTEKGAQMWNGIRNFMNYVDADYAKESKLNHQLNAPAKRPIERATFYSDLNTMSGKDFFEKYAEHWNMKTKIKRFIIMHVPYTGGTRLLRYEKIRSHQYWHVRGAASTCDQPPEE